MKFFVPVLVMLVMSICLKTVIKEPITDSGKQTTRSFHGSVSNTNVSQALLVQHDNNFETASNNISIVMQ